MNVLVYNGPEVIAASLTHTLSTLRALLTPNYTVQPISHQALQSQPWPTSCALLVFPGCRRVLPSAIPTIAHYLDTGGSLLAFSAGAKRVGSGLENVASLGLSLDSSLDDTSFRFYDRPSKSYITLSPSTLPEGSSTERLSMQAADGSTVEGLQSHASIIGLDGTTDRVKVLGHFTGGHDLAGIHIRVGDGRGVIWAASVEYPIPDDALKLNEERRHALLRDDLTFLGLRLPSNDDPVVSRPSPLFLVSHSAAPEAVSSVISAFTGSDTITAQVIEDENDSFLFHSPQDLIPVKSQCQADYLASSDPSAWQPKHILVYTGGDQPDVEDTPLFSTREYFECLSAARIREKCIAKEGSWGFGECLMYGEVVTSTQTMLDKNPRILASLPPPFVSLASFQLAGRGRGSNIWLSPAGCLQFSLLLRVDLGSFPPSKLVFVQYLFALAVAEACRDERVLGRRGEAVRIKWPNDIYATTPTGENKKIGGILVNTNFSGGTCHVVIGTGTNIFNPPPIFSLSQLQGPDDTPLSMEATAATILAKFEGMWTTFIRGNGSFEPFMDLYLQRWLHSDQLVTLTTTTPPTQVRICGITPEYGLLRTMPERKGWSSGDEGFIDLQPDGNSFDIMAGMIKSKS